jgi:hypothetical protein
MYNGTEVNLQQKKPFVFMKKNIFFNIAGRVKKQKALLTNVLQNLLLQPVQCCPL